jgi:hypothetical protein
MEVSQLLSEFERICCEKQYDCTTLGSVGERKFPLLVIDIKPKKPKKTLVIFGGVHGNETSGTLAIREYLKTAHIPRSTRVIFFPLVNPWGMDKNKRSNEYRADLNRFKSFQSIQKEQGLILGYLMNTKIDGFISFHEDWMIKKFYFYAYNEAMDSTYRKIQKEAEKVMACKDKDKIDGFPAKRGIVYNHKDTSWENLMYQRGVPFILVPEIGKQAEIETRVECVRRMIERITT